jgi:hypothetical protein
MWIFAIVVASGNKKIISEHEKITISRGSERKYIEVVPPDRSYRGVHP